MAIQINGTSGISGVDGSAATPALQGVDSNTGISFGTDEVSINTGGTTRVKVDSSGRLGVGTTSPSAQLQVNSGDIYIAARSGSTETGIFFRNPTDTATYAKIGYTDSTSKLVLGTTNNYATTLLTNNIERATITNDGYLCLGKTSYDNDVNGAWFSATNTGDNFQCFFTTTRADGNASPVFVNRQSSDGTLIEFRQANVTEGAITVSGSTVTYGGGHLARWSQLPNDEDPSVLLKGTVMSNLDEMCEWGEEDNEQLNKTKVSDLEGDPSVAGVFVSTSPSDDGPLDYWLAMTGDMIIRIAEDVTVQRGDLLMSAGDGTAKPQDDDIVRSKTIAKVTSNHVTCTYDDGSYCVPCVLMAC